MDKNFRRKQCVELQIFAMKYFHQSRCVCFHSRRLMNVLVRNIFSCFFFRIFANKYHEVEQQQQFPLNIWNYCRIWLFCLSTGSARYSRFIIVSILTHQSIFDVDLGQTAASACSKCGSAIKFMGCISIARMLFAVTLLKSIT